MENPSREPHIVQVRGYFRIDVYERPVQLTLGSLDLEAQRELLTEVLLSTGAFVTSVDLSSAVEANQENFPQDERHRIIQADVLRLPFPQGQYDTVFCLGVIQHTPRPEETLEKL
jgi:2-polyprenyl-3-methyl-5-hydroxy-6-metoxy-1,4-benzoquinol methylase